MIARSRLTAANSSAIALLPEASRMLEKAVTIDEIRKVENLAQLAREYAKAGGLGRDAINSATRHGLDARRKAGATLKAMRERPDPAERGKQKISEHPIFTLQDLVIGTVDSLTASHSSIATFSEGRKRPGRGVPFVSRPMASNEGEGVKNETPLRFWRGTI